MKSEKDLSWLITGGCGFIGKNLVAYLLKENPNVKIRVLDNLSVGTKKDLSQNGRFVEKDLHSLKGLPFGVELVVGDIRDFRACLKCCTEIDIIVHLAASTGVPQSVEDPRQDMEVNVMGTFNMLEAARQTGVRRLVFASSGAPLGNIKPPIHEELAPHPVSPYGSSKLAGEGYCSAYYQSFGIETIALRFSNVYGPGSDHKNSVVAKFIRQAIHGGSLEIYGDGNQTRDFIFIEDLLQAIHLAATTNGIGGQVFQIATGVETSVIQLLDKLNSVMANSGFEDVHVIYRPPRKGDVIRNFSDISKAKSMLGWHSGTALDKGLNRTLDWYMKKKGGSAR